MPATATRLDTVTEVAGSPLSICPGVMATPPVAFAVVAQSSIDCVPVLMAPAQMLMPNCKSWAFVVTVLGCQTFTRVDEVIVLIPEIIVEVEMLGSSVAKHST